MKKSTPYDFGSPESPNTKDLTLKDKALPTTAKKQTVENILAFSHAYSVRKSKKLEYIDFILN